LAIPGSVYYERTAEYYQRYRIVNNRNREEEIEDLKFVPAE
jgi:hypothetical protein